MFKNNKDKKEVLAAVKDGGYLLKYADKSLLKDKEIDELDKGLEEGRYTPEMDVEMHDGDFNIEYVLIETSKGKEVYRDEDYDG